MTPPKDQRPRSTPTKSPDPKKAKLTPAQVRGQQKQNNKSNMAAPTAKRALMDTDDAASDEGFLSACGPPRWFLEYEQRLEDRFDTLLDRINGRLEALSVKVDEHEERFRQVDFDHNALKSEVRNLRDEKDVLLDKVDDLENRSRRNNLIFYGVPELEAQPENCNETLKELFNFVGIDPSIWDNVSRCHRTPTQRPQGQGPNAKPRKIHIGFASFTARENVRKACLSKFKASSEFKGRKIFVADDLSKRVQQKRKDKMGIFKKLKEEGKKPFFSYPAKLKYRSVDGNVVDVDLQKMFTGFK